MTENVLISYLGENKPNLISEITSHLTEIGGEFSGVTFATLGRVCELTMVYQTNDKVNLENLQEEVSNHSSLKDLGIEPTDVEKAMKKWLWRFREGGQFAKI